MTQVTIGDITTEEAEEKRSRGCSQQSPSQRKIFLLLVGKEGQTPKLYHTNEQLSDLITKLSWSSHILILSSCKTEEEREFYLRLSVKENYSKRQLERQIDTGYYERFML